MKDKLKSYIDDIFADAPKCEKTEELKEEMYVNLCDRYDDLINEGKSKAAAYNSVIAGVGDVSEIINTIRREEFQEREPVNTIEYTMTSEEKDRLAKYKSKKAILSAISTAMYIVCWLPLVLASCIVGSEVNVIIGLCIMMLIIAVSTGIKIYISATAPESLKQKKSVVVKSEKKHAKKRHPFKTIFAAILWPVTVVIFLVGIIRFRWIGYWWLVFIIAAAVQNIADAIVDLVTGGDNNE